MTEELWSRDAWELADRVRAGELSARKLLEQSLARIERLNPKLNAVCFLDPDRAWADAELVDKRVEAREDPGAFAGIPMGVKELAQVQGWPDTHASVPSVHGPIVRSVRDAARYLDATAGPSLTDPTSLPKPEIPFEDRVVSGEATERLRGKRAAWSSTLGYAGTDPEVEKLTHDAALALVDEAGLELVDIPVDLPKPGVAWGLLSSLNIGAFHLDFERDHLDELDDVHPAGGERPGRPRRRPSGRVAGRGGAPRRRPLPRRRCAHGRAPAVDQVRTPRVRLTPLRCHRNAAL